MRSARTTLISLVLLLLLLAVASPGGVAAGASTQPFPDEIDLPAGWAPEGITAGRGTTVFVGSLATGGIWEGDVRRGTGSVLVTGETGQVAVGVDYEARRNRLWVAGGPTGTVRVYGASSGDLLASYQFTAGFLNDLVVTRQAVYVTDSLVKQLAVIPLGPRGALPDEVDVETRPLTGDIVFEPGEFNANGIVAIGRWLIVAQSFTGELFRVDPDTGVTETINLGGATVPGADGLELHGRTLYVVRGAPTAVVDVFRLARSARSAELLGSLTDPGFDFPTTGAHTAGRLWVVNARFNTTPTPTTRYWITQLPARP
jgi:hypothetical protein